MLLKTETGASAGQQPPLLGTLTSTPSALPPPPGCRNSRCHRSEGPSPGPRWACCTPDQQSRRDWWPPRTRGPPRLPLPPPIPPPLCPPGSSGSLLSWAAHPVGLCSRRLRGPGSRRLVARHSWECRNPPRPGGPSADVDGSDPEGAQPLLLTCPCFFLWRVHPAWGWSSQARQRCPSRLQALCLCPLASPSSFPPPRQLPGLCTWAGHPHPARACARPTALGLLRL